MDKATRASFEASSTSTEILPMEAITTALANTERIVLVRRYDAYAGIAAIVDNCIVAAA